LRKIHVVEEEGESRTSKFTWKLTDTKEGERKCPDEKIVTGVGEKEKND